MSKVSTGLSNDNSYSQSFTKLTTISTDYAMKNKGSLIYDPLSKKVKYSDGNNWFELGGSGGETGGNIISISPLTADLDAASYKILNLPNPTSLQDPVTLSHLQDNYLKLSGGTMTGNITMGNNKISLSYVPSADNDAVNVKYVKDKFLPLTGGTMSGVIDMGNNKIINSADPRDPQDVVNVKYFDRVSITLKGVCNVLGGNPIFPNYYANDKEPDGGKPGFDKNLTTGEYVFDNTSIFWGKDVRFILTLRFPSSSECWGAVSVTNGGTQTACCLNSNPSSRNGLPNASSTVSDIIIIDNSNNKFNVISSAINTPYLLTIDILGQGG